MKLPCEQALWYVLPRVRADLAKELVKMGLSQKDVAVRLGITPSAVSQYLHKKRGNKARMPKSYQEKMKKAADSIFADDDETVAMTLICSCCTASRKA